MKQFALCSKQYDILVAPWLWETLIVRFPRPSRHNFGSIPRHIKHCRKLILHLDEHDLQKEMVSPEMLIKLCTPTSLDLNVSCDGLSFTSCLAAISEMDNLSDLRLNLHLEEIPQFDERCAKKLKSLSLDGGNATNISNLTRLEILEFDGTLVSEDVLNDISMLPSLKILRASNINLDDLNFLSSLTQLEDLNLSENTIYDSMHHLEALTRLRILNLTDTCMTDLELRYLKSLFNLEQLNLCFNNSITDVGVKHIAHLTELKCLDLLFTAVGYGDGFEHISGLLQLRELCLTDSSITDFALMCIAPLILLENLDLSGSLITDSGLKYMESLTGLKNLNVERTSLTSIGLKHVACLTKLQVLDLDDCRVTEAEVEELIGQLPKVCMVHAHGRYYRDAWS